MTAKPWKWKGSLNQEKLQGLKSYEEAAWAAEDRTAWKQRGNSPIFTSRPEQWCWWSSTVYMHWVHFQKKILKLKSPTHLLWLGVPLLPIIRILVGFRFLSSLVNMKLQLLVWWLIKQISFHVVAVSWVFTQCLWGREALSDNRKMSRREPLTKCLKRSFALRNPWFGSISPQSILTSHT